MSQYIFTLPVPPSANRYWRIYNNRIVVTDEALAYKQEVQLLLRQIKPLQNDVSVNFTVFRPARRGDLDNFNKILLDSLQGLAYGNDNQIVEIHSFRDDDKINPRVEFLVYE
jgi:crossover junction endodeoxyribonuclease RusA